LAVINIATIKPLDRDTILHYAKDTGAVVTVEEHQVAGGLGSAVAELLAQEAPTPQEFVGVRDAFGQSGSVGELYEYYKLSASHIKAAIQKAHARKS
jgi:transketolase